MTKRARGWEKVVGRRKRPVRAGVPSSPPGKKRLLIDKVAKDRISEIMLGWKQPKFNWPRLMKEVNKEFGGSWAYQSVAKFKTLQALFTATQKRIRKERARDAAGGGKKTVDATTVVVQDRVAYLQRENEDLKRKLAEVDARMARWRHNAVMAKYSLAVLDEPLQENNRGRSDRKKPAR